jgi:signal transduction histidine kinase
MASSTACSPIRGTPAAERQKVDLNALVEEALTLAFHGARARDKDFNVSLGRDFASGVLLVELTPQNMTRVFLNLIDNGFYAARPRKSQSGTRLCCER